VGRSPASTSRERSRVSGATLPSVPPPAPTSLVQGGLSVGVRDENGQVHTVGGEIFDPTVNPDNGAVDEDDLEYHIVFHDAPGPMTNNFPPPLAFFYHLTFEDVKVSIRD
jgi:hypothetical protein